MGRRRRLLNLWQTGVARFDELKGIDWHWLSMDGAMTKAPLLAPVGRCKELLLHFGLLGDKKA
jgi:hypothetical protein